MFSTPAVAGDLLIVGSCNGMIRALDAKTGEVRWAYDIRQDGRQSQFHGDPIITEKLVIIGTDGEIGHVYAFELKTGKVTWKYLINERGASADPARLGTRVYATTLGGWLACLDLETGSEVWTSRNLFTAEGSCAPAVGADRVFVAGQNGIVFALDAASGKMLWKRELGARLTTSLIRGTEGVYVGTAGRALYRLNPETGDVVTQLAVESQPVGRLVGTDGSLLVFLGEETLASVEFSLAKVRWTQTAAKEWTSARPYVWRGMVLAADRRELCAFRLADGVREWSHQFPETVRGIGVADEVFYIGTLRGPIFAFQTKPER